MAFGFLTNKEAQEKIASLESQIADLESQLASANEQLEMEKQNNVNQSEEVAVLREQLENRETLLTEQEQKIVDLETQVAKIPELEQAAAVTPEKVSEQAAVLLASQGHQPVELSAEASQESDVLSELSALKGAEKTKFYQAHAKEIKAALRKLNS